MQLKRLDVNKHKTQCRMYSTVWIRSLRSNLLKTLKANPAFTSTSFSVLIYYWYDLCKSAYTCVCALQHFNDVIRFQRHNLLYSASKFSRTVLQHTVEGVSCCHCLCHADSQSGSLAWIFLRTLSVLLSARITCIQDDDCLCVCVTVHKRPVVMGLINWDTSLGRPKLH